MIGWLVRVVESPLGDSKRSPPLLRAVSPGTTQRKVLHSFSLSRFSKLRIISERQGILNLPKVGKNICHLLLFSPVSATNLLCCSWYIGFVTKQYLLNCLKPILKWLWPWLVKVDNDKDVDKDNKCEQRYHRCQWCWQQQKEQWNEGLISRVILFCLTPLTACQEQQEKCQ